MFHCCLLLPFHPGVPQNQGRGSPRKSSWVEWHPTYSRQGDKAKVGYTKTVLWGPYTSLHCRCGVPEPPDTSQEARAAHTCTHASACPWKQVGVGATPKPTGCRKGPGTRVQGATVSPLCLRVGPPTGAWGDQQTCQVAACGNQVVGRKGWDPQNTCVRPQFHHGPHNEDQVRLPPLRRQVRVTFEGNPSPLRMAPRTQTLFVAAGCGGSSNRVSQSRALH